MYLKSDGQVGQIFPKFLGSRELPVEDPESRPDNLE